jgi:hypothetical protein
MRRVLFGELLGRLVRLSGHDVSEILEDQAASRRRFGEIALAWGLCQPQHVWQAWWAQLSNQTPQVDLQAIGIDAQALSYLPRGLAVAYGVIPLRTFKDQLVLAATPDSLKRAKSELPGLLVKKVKFVLAEPAQVREAITTYYPRTTVSATARQTATAATTTTTTARVAARVGTRVGARVGTRV